MMAMVLWASALSAQSHWQCDYAKFSESMAIYFQMADGDNAIADVTPYEVAAFVGEECRGVATFHEEMINENTVKYGYLRIYSNAESAEKIILKVYNKSTQLEKRIAISSFPFEKDKRIGVPSEPVKYDITANVPQYQLTVTPQDAEMGTAEGSGTFEEDEIVHIKATANTGYHFVKWSDEDTDEERTIVITQKTDLVAVFAPNQHLLTFISEGDTVRSALQDYNSTIVPPETPQKEGYSFVKWMPNLAEKMPNNPLTYEATFKINEYTMTFMVDGKAVREAVLEYGKPVPVPQSPSKTAYTFAGWDPVVPATVPGSNMTFTAQWTPITYSISYDLAGGQLAEGETNPASYTIESAAITLKTPTREGYTFAGWTGTDLGAAAMSVTIATGKYGERTYTATWTPITYNLTYDLASGALPEGKTNPVTYTIETEDITLVNPERTAYTFAGWTGTGLDQATAEVKIAKGSTGDRSYTATWSPVTYTITYDLAGGVLAEGETNPASYTIESEAITLKTPTREGYTFAGWTGTGIEGTSMAVTIAAGSTGVRSYTATWTPITYNLTYELANGVLPEGKTNPATYTIETADFTLINPERTGYEFAGWTGTGLDKATVEVKIAKGSIGDRSYTATWTPIGYTVSYDLAGGQLAEGDTNPASYTIESEAITLKNPTREGYTFAGWTGTGIEGTSMAVTIAAGSTGVRSYTATWTPITYTISYDLDGGQLAQGDTNPVEYTIESDDITLKNPTKDGYEFAGWTGTDLTQATMTVTIAKGSIGNRTYTATWTPASGIRAIFRDSKTVNVYTVNGTLVGRDKTIDEVIQLKHGVYVINGKKIAIK